MLTSKNSDIHLHYSCSALGTLVLMLRKLVSSDFFALMKMPNQLSNDVKTGKRSDARDNLWKRNLSRQSVSLMSHTEGAHIRNPAQIEP